MIRSKGFKNARRDNLEMSMTPGMMTPIEEESNTLISDTASNLSNNSRNFQMPHKDLIQEINKQRENMMVYGVESSDRNNQSMKEESLI